MAVSICTHTVTLPKSAGSKKQAQNRRLRHLHGISIRNLALSQTKTRPRGNTVDDAALPTALRSPAKVLAQQERLQLEHSRSITDFKAIAASEHGSITKAKDKDKPDAQSDVAPGKGPPLRRLRRRSTLDWQNASSQYRQKKLEDVVSANMAHVFFSLHVPAHEEPVYVSEVIEKTMNPDFRFFDLDEAGPSVSRLEDLTVKVWAKREGARDYQYLVEMQLNLRSLQFIGKTIEGFPQPLPQNCILFHMKDGIYTSFLDNFTGEPSVPVSPPPRTMSIPQVLPTSSYDALMRLSTLDECVQDALATRAKLEEEINLILEANAEPIRTVREVSLRSNALSNINDAVATERKRLAAARRRRDDLQFRLKQRKDYIASGYRFIRDGEADTNALVSEIKATKEQLSLVTEETLGQRRRICEDLQKIYPIIPLPNKTLHFSIRDLPLPNSVFDDASDETTSAALGHVSLILDRLQYYLSVPLPYPVTVRGSTSTISDPISEVAGGQGKGGRLYPLFGGRGARFRFEFGVFLFNKDIELLSERLGLRVLDLRQTLPNLKYLLYVATAGKGEIPARKAGGIRGFLRGGGVGGSAISSRRESMDSEGSSVGGAATGEGKGLMLPPPKPTAGSVGLNGSAIGNGNLKLGYGQMPLGRGSKLRDVS
jgi:hypothetical protein